MNQEFENALKDELDGFRKSGTMKTFQTLEAPQAPNSRMKDRGEVLILSSNNYLGLANDPKVIEAGVKALQKYGAGTGSVRFICGTFEIHHQLEEALAKWVGTEASLSFVSCWTANEGLFPTISPEGTTLLSDELNHASIIDACRLASKAKRLVYKHVDLKDLKAKLAAEAGAKRRIVVTDGVFSMEGDLAPLPDLVDLCNQHNAILVVDDSHATGVLGATGRGTAEHFGVLGKVDIITSTLGKALGGAAGGFVAGSRNLISYLEQKCRTQLFSNALAPTIAGSALEALQQLKKRPELITALKSNTAFFRKKLLEAGFHPIEGETPIVPVLIGETAKAIATSKKLLDKGVFVTGFGFPVVPEGKARIRFQVSAAHTQEQLLQAIKALSETMSPVKVHA